jgi:hypothetical protein
MKRPTRIALTLSTLVGLAACTDRPIAPPDRVASIASDGGDACAPLAALSSSAFYAQFEYRYPSDDAQLNQLNDGGAAHAAFNDASHPLHLTATLMTSLWINMFPDGTYRAAYNELACDPGGLTCGTNDPDVVLGGHWSLDGDDLVFAGLGRGTRAFVLDWGASPCVPSIDLVYARDLRSPGLAGLHERVMSTDFATSTMGLF